MINKCPDCNQEIVDNKTFCTNCGKRLRVDKYTNTNPIKTFAIVAIVMLLFGVGTMYLIANVGLESQLDKILNNNSNSSIYNGSYIIKDLVTTDKSDADIKEIKESIIGFEVELSDSKFKVGLFQILWATINNPTISTLKNKELHKTNLNITSDNYDGISIVGKNIERDGKEEETFELIKIGNDLFLYYDGTYFELEKSKLDFESTKTYYKVDLIEKDYNKNINTEIDKLNKHIKSVVESGSNEIYAQSYEVIKDGDFIQILLNENDGYINSSIVNTITNLAFNNKTGTVFDLKSYVESINLNFDNIINQYNQLKENVYQSSIDEITEKLDIKSTSVFYVRNDILHIHCGNNQWGMVFLEIVL